MAINSTFDRYLSHLGATVPVSSLHFDPDSRGLRALRHDVDYDLDIALEMAHREYEQGARATYYVLPTTSYWADPRLIEKCLQLQDYGHEVGLHVNCMAQWAGGETDDPVSLLQSQLARLREGGVEIVGIAAHGDRRCYEYNVSNYWCFKELRPTDPFKSENGRTAEGPYEADGTPRLIYPSNEIVERPDGSLQPLWSIPMASLGLRYHAWHTNFDRYFSDSGGNWTRTSDPLDFQPGNERWQVLIHPIHWQGPKRLYFFLSSARSGSRWLSEVLDQATPVTARHEHILNQDFHRGETAQKATATIRMLDNQPEEIQARLSEAWEELQLRRGDYAEVNVYLESYVEELRRFFPDAKFVHLHRHPAKVVRSLMDRDWYDTPEDHAHPRLRDANESKMNQFERVCQYVTEVNSRLLVACDERVSLEELTQGPEELARCLKRLGIAYHPRLGQSSVSSIINATRAPSFPEPAEWTLEQQQCFNQLCGYNTTALGYDSLTSDSFSHVRHVMGEVKRRLRSSWRRIMALRYSSESPVAVNRNRTKGHNCDIQFDGVNTIIHPLGNGRHAYVALGGSSWHAVVQEKEGRSGWPVQHMFYMQGNINAEIEGGTSATLFAISYGEDDKQIHRRQLGILDAHRPCLTFSFAPHPKSITFDIIMYMSEARFDTAIVLTQHKLKSKPHSW